ncbi:MAG: aminoacyl-tRNA hydrolase [Parachlamydia sp.]|nr:aminoacyl-tRNA hydrolase [Parachlamydia sp.]
MEESWVIAGLGNPGKRYEKTRHNYGELVIRDMARRLGWVVKEDRHFQALVAKGNFAGKTVILAVPLTYMNESGRAIRALLDYYKVPVDHLAIACDDVAIDFGTMRLRAEGSAGGHNGLKSVEAHIGTSHYMRLRLGVGRGRPEKEQTLADYVLDAFSSEEMAALPVLLEKAGVALSDLMCVPVQTVMNRINAPAKKVNLGDQHESTQAKPLRRDVCHQSDLERGSPPQSAG